MTKPDYLISTPENVDLHLELAGLGNRALACLLDTVLTWVAITLVTLLAWLLVVLIQLPAIPSNVRAILSGVTIMIATFVAFAITFGYYIYFEVFWHGQTPGKRVAQIRVIEQNGQPVSVSAVVIRNLIRVFDEGLLLIGLLPMLIDKNERRFGDLAAGTLVIRERLPQLSTETIHLSNHLVSAATLDAGKISPQEYEILVSFLRRRDRLAKAHRPLVARKLEQHFRERLGEPSTGEQSEHFLESVYKAYQSRAGT
jgi:uncharacterized RDD family membrane protein YckC